MDKNIIVTGASRGIGYQTALELAQQKHTVIAIARSTERLEKLAAERTEGTIIPLPADLTSQEDIKNIEQQLATMDGIHGLINNAGAVQRKAFMDTDMEDWQKLVDINLYAIVSLTQAIKPHMPAGSHIVNISSMSGFQGSSKFPGLSVYGASKAAVIGLSEVLSTEFAEDDIAVNCLCLGAVQTEMLEEAFPGFEAPVSAQQIGQYVANFVLSSHHFYNGKVLPVALNNPE
ncbi:MAG: SDR family oxidoreductase [Balneolaceae bacterium]|nr:SDR family oxidoreductase [Balneolaceae bacterium]